jgi:hypothetical protein
MKWFKGSGIGECGNWISEINARNLNQVGTSTYIHKVVQNLEDIITPDGYWKCNWSLDWFLNSWVILILGLLIE